MSIIVSKSVSLGIAAAITHEATTSDNPHKKHVQKQLHSVATALAFAAEQNNGVPRNQFLGLCSRVVALLEFAECEFPRKERLHIVVQTMLSAAQKHHPPHKPVAMRIAEHNEKALAAMLLLSQEINSYPYLECDKAAARAFRVSVPSIQHFQQGAFLSEVFSETAPLSSCTAFIACAMGHREHMEDRFLAVPLHFMANGKVIAADLIGVFDGHGGPATVEHVFDSLQWRLKAILEVRLREKDPNEEDIFYALKETVELLHAEVIGDRLRGANSKRDKSGTTAIIGFKLADENDLWTANIGDSSGFLVCNSAAIPMSIAQKPHFFPNADLERVDFNRPNEYARQLLDKGVTIKAEAVPMSRQIFWEMFEAQKSMVMTYAKSLDGTAEVRLGAPQNYLDMARAIGDAPFEKWVKQTPEIFRQTLKPGALLVLHSDGIAAKPGSIAGIIENDRRFGCPLLETAECLVQSSFSSGDNVCAMIVSFDNHVPRDDSSSRRPIKLLMEAANLP